VHASASLENDSSFSGQLSKPKAETARLDDYRRAPPDAPVLPAIDPHACETYK